MDGPSLGVVIVEAGVGGAMTSWVLTWWQEDSARGAWQQYERIEGMQICRGAGRALRRGVRRGRWGRGGQLKRGGASETERRRICVARCPGACAHGRFVD